MILPIRWWHLDMQTNKKMNVRNKCGGGPAPSASFFAFIIIQKIVRYKQEKH